MEEDSICPICYDDNLDTCKFTHFPCKHKICNSCFLGVIKRIHRVLFCPFCRTIIPLCQGCKKAVLKDDEIFCKYCNLLVLPRLLRSYVTTGINYIAAARYTLPAAAAGLLLTAAMFFTHDRYLITFDIRFVITCIFSLCMYHFIYE